MIQKLKEKLSGLWRKKDQKVSEVVVTIMLDGKKIATTTFLH